MPNRVIRDWTASERIDKLTQGGEVFFTRLMMKADDYGNYTGNIKLINAALFPLKDLNVIQVESYLKECLYLKLVRKYKIDGKEYLNIPDFNQSLRRMKSIYPPPPDGNARTNDGALRTSDGHTTDKRRPESETETNLKQETESESEGATAQVLVWPSFEDFWSLYDKKIDRSKCEKKFKKIQQGAREKIMLHLDDYVKSTPEVIYRKNPYTYLNNESWNNEIVKQNGKHEFNPTESAKRIDEMLRAREDT